MMRPHMISTPYGEDIDIGRVLVANANDSLPKETKYKTTKSSSVAVKFR